ncbi:MAG: DUF2911 domain-containing protein [Bacteroidetes bacterium]|nr:DUF2911 domain-containing protein [Bacteroidota bacterium]
MKKFLSVFTFITIAFAMQSAAQNDASKRPSPPMTANATIGGANISIKYSSPSVKGREIWGKLVPYGEIWRTGANEATVFETDQDVSINGSNLPKGKYALFTIPEKEEWTIVFSKNSSQWGTYSYKTSEDVLRVKAKAASAEHQEQLKIDVQADGNASIHWEKVKVNFTIKH